MESSIKEMEKVLKATAHQKRLAILNLLFKKKEMNVSEIADELNLPFATTSRNLIILAKAELLNYRQKGALFYYSINSSNSDSFIHSILAILKSSFKKKSYLISYTDSKLLPPKAKAALGPFIEPRPK